jgi:hypothetical protein
MFIQELANCVSSIEVVGEPSFVLGNQVYAFEELTVKYSPIAMSSS